MLDKRNFYINGKSLNPGTLFGSYRQSGNSREGGTWGLEEYLEVKIFVAGSNFISNTLVIYLKS